MKHLLVLLTGALLSGSLAKPITVTLLHTNDLHARVEPVTVGQNTYGGYARQLTLLKRYVESDPNPLVLSAGDTFQGTLYFNVYGGLADLLFMNLMGYQAMAVGNHEFDLGPQALANFAKGARFPMLAANLDVSAEPLLRDLIKPSTVLTVDGERIGIVGAVTPDLPLIANPGPNVKMLDTKTSVTQAVAALQAQGVNKVILLSHLGYALEKEIAASVPGVDVIVGAHSHTLLGTFNNPDFPQAEGPYPTVVQNADGNRALIVTAWEWGKVLGRIKVSFDDQGRVESWADAQPIVVDKSIPDDPTAASMVATLQVPLANLRQQVVGQTQAGLNGARELVRKRETPMANVVADANLEAGKAAGAVAALVNGGGVRASINAGPITFDEALAVQPFGNTLVVLDLTGDEIRRALEHGVAGWAEGRGQFLHVSSGMKYTFDLSKPAGQRVTAVTLDGQPIDPARTYRVVVNNFIAAGGDGFEVLQKATGRRIDSGALDVDVLVNYLKAKGTVDARDEGRITVLNEPR